MEACGHPYVAFMVPDYPHLDVHPCTHQCDCTDSQSPQPSDVNYSSYSKNFQQSDTKGARTSLSLSISAVITDKTSDQQGQHLPMAEGDSEIDRAFFDLWLAQPSWSPIVKGQHGWKTAVSSSGKKVPLTLSTIESYYRRGLLIGKRFGKLTNYLLIDVDTGSPFHPRHGGIQPILAAMESLGLCRYLLIRSSASGGIHIYFPLAESVSAYRLACAAHAALSAANVKVCGGICELFPNKKAYNAEHNGHRLPLQADSFILDEDFRCIGNSKAAFLQQWQLCAARQDEACLAELLVEKPLPVPQRISVDALPPISWKAPGQSNEVMKKLVNYGDSALGLNTIQSLGDWMMAVAPQLPGFDQFASKESKNDLTRRNWAYRWAKSHFKSVRMYTAKTSYDYNATVAAEALERLLIALNRIIITGKIGIKALWRSLSEISRELFGVGFSWRLFQKHRQLILEKVGSSRKVGLSRGDEEGKSSLSSEPVGTADSKSSEGARKGIAQLSTARSVTPIQDADLSASPTPSEGESLGGDGAAETGAELAMGTAVIFQQSGSAGEGVQTRVTGKTTVPDGTLLYRLEECAEGKPLIVPGDCLTVVTDELGSQMAGSVIRATAAQLLQVLGKACPFSGPGLWTVKRDEVSPLAWRQLMRLVGEG